MPVDWIVCPDYGEDLTIPGGQQAAFPLYRLPDSVTNDVAQVENEDDRNVCLRIVGQVYVHTFGVQGVPVPRSVGWRIMPLQCNWDFAVPQFPLDPAITRLESDDVYANLRWWDERFYSVTPFDPATEGDQSMQEFDHPFWTQVNCKPKQSFGRNSNLWPCIVFDNPYTDSFLQWRHRLRMLVTYR